MNWGKLTALVTGGAVRIGRAICEALAVRGCAVAVHYRSSEDEARELVPRLEREGVRAWAVRADLDDEAACEALVEEVWQLAGGCEILVNNAAVFHKQAFLEADRSSLLGEWQTNLLAPLALLSAFSRRLLPPEAGGSGAGTAVRALRGRAVNLLDRRVAGVEAGCLPYLLSKKMLAESTRALALELAPWISVNGVAPGAILAPPGEGEQGVRELRGRVPLAQAGTPAAVAEAVAFLAGADAITGQILYVDGGQHLQ